MLRIFLAGSLAIFSMAAAADAEHPEIDCAKIKNYAAAGDKAYKAKQYEKARDSYTEQVGWSETCQLPDSVIATAYNNVALTWIRQGEYLKAKAWLLIDEKDAKSQYNLALIKEKIAALPQPASPIGEYWEYAGRGMWSSYVISAAGKEYKVNFDGVWAGLAAMYYGPNIGSLEGKAAILNGQGVLRQRDGDDEWGNCDVKLSFTPMSLATSVTGDCAFGHNVSAAGHYVRVK
ncbi:tetratricopeptide repeat protein [Kalamiella sp. sgz302252]|uniref:tetratricopeptide repeat protein n=1 Tax=Pantoea sp. sgz302252 TaxID=3341827 RepID=UPI0036D33874